MCVCADAAHLVVGELGRVLQLHLLGLHGVVACGQGQATQGIATGSPVLDHSQDLVLDGVGEGHAGCSDSDVCASVNHTLWGTLLEKMKRHGHSFNHHRF